jgi:alginate O-acetyltransferase complex protein AlgI
MRFVFGLSKKVLIANVLGETVSEIYKLDAALIDSSLAWIAAIAYTMQLYFDFSGYSDMAIGLGEMLGFKIPENFNFPYISKSIPSFGSVGTFH